MSSTLLPPPREQLCNRSCSNKTHTCRFLDLGLTFLLVSAYCTRARLSFPDVYVGVVECVPASPHTYSSSTKVPPHTGFPMRAHLSRLRLFQRHLRSLVWVGVWVWDWIHSHTPPCTSSPSSRHPPFTHYPCPPCSLVCGGQPSPHKTRFVVSHSTCPCYNTGLFHPTTRPVDPYILILRFRSTRAHAAQARVLASAVHGRLSLLY